MRAVSVVDPSTTILGYSSRIPVFVSGAALAKLGHPLGEVNITRGCGRAKVIQMVSSNSSCSFAELAQARTSPEQPLFFQLYKNRDDQTAMAKVKHVEELGYKAIFLTVDAVVMSNRERDIKAKSAEQDEMASMQEAGRSTTASQRQDLEDDDEAFDTSGTAGALIASSDRDMTWEKARDFINVR